MYSVNTVGRKTILLCSVTVVCTGQLRYFSGTYFDQRCRSTSHYINVQSPFLDVDIYLWMLLSTPIEVEWFKPLKFFSSRTGSPMIWKLCM